MQNPGMSCLHCHGASLKSFPTLSSSGNMCLCCLYALQCQLTQLCGQIFEFIYCTVSSKTFRYCSSNCCVNGSATSLNGGDRATSTWNNMQASNQTCYHSFGGRHHCCIWKSCGCSQGCGHPHQKKSERGKGEVGQKKKKRESSRNFKRNRLSVVKQMERWRWIDVLLFPAELFKSNWHAFIYSVTSMHFISISSFQPSRFEHTLSVTSAFLTVNGQIYGFCWLTRLCCSPI